MLTRQQSFTSDSMILQGNRSARLHLDKMTLLILFLSGGVRHTPRVSAFFAPSSLFEVLSLLFANNPNPKFQI